MWWSTFNGGVDFESGGSKDFVKSDMERGGNFGFIDVESVESIGEDVVVGRVIYLEWTRLLARIRELESSFWIQVAFLWLGIVGCL